MQRLRSSTLLRRECEALVYVGREYCDRAIPRYNIGERLMVTEVKVQTTGITYYEVTDVKTTPGGWYNACLFKRLDDIRDERLEELGI